MHETDYGFYNIESPSPRAEINAGFTWVTGWLTPKSGEHFVDLRFRRGGKTFPGILGFPREDVASFFPANPAARLSGFQVLVELLPGHSILSIEALDLHGHWQPLGHVVYAVKNSSTDCQLAPSRKKLTAVEFSRLLMLRLKNPAISSTEIRDQLPRPIALWDSHPPFHAHMSEPAIVAPVRHGKLEVQGWIFHEFQTIKRAFVTADLLTLQPLHLGGVVLNNHAQFLPFSNAASDILGSVTLISRLKDAITIRLYAELDDGTLHLVTATRCLPIWPKNIKGPWPLFSYFGFLRQKKTLLSELSVANVEVDRAPALKRQLKLLLQEYRREAPRRVTTKDLRLRSRPAKLSLLLVTNNLNLEDAPLFLLEYARYFHDVHHASLTVVSPDDGLLRAGFAQLGANIVITTCDAASSVLNLGNFALVVANTLASKWAVILAAKRGIPSLFYVHESQTPEIYFRTAPREELDLAYKALAQASAVCFLSEATRRHYTPRSNHHIISHWIDLARIQIWLSENPRLDSRRRIGLHSHEKMVLCVAPNGGREEPHDFVRSVELLSRQNPALAARCRFVILGGKNNADNSTLRDHIAALDRSTLSIVDEPTDIQDYYSAADVFVCIIYEEPSLRVILNAMAFGAPILSTDAHCIPEIVRNGREALLTQPGDIAALCLNIQNLLSNPDLAGSLAARACQRVREFDAALVCTRHVELSGQIARLPKTLIRKVIPSFFHIDNPARGAIFSPGRHLLRGWVLPKTGRHFVDVRVRIGERIFPGVHGLPRMDLAEFFKTGQKYALAEFYVAVELDASPSPVEIIFEVLDIKGDWTVFTRSTHQINSSAAAEDIAVPSGPLRWHEFTRALQLLLRHQRSQTDISLETLARHLVATIPYPRDLRHPHAPFIGHLDEPAAVLRNAHGRSPVIGFLFHQTQGIRRVLATFDLQVWQTIEHGKPSPDIGAHYPQFPSAQNCALFGVIDVPTQLPDPICVRVYAELEDGTLHLCSVQRSRRYTGEDEKSPYPAQSIANFAQTHAALQAAVKERGMLVHEDDDLRRELGRLAEDFSLRAPRFLPALTPLQKNSPNPVFIPPKHILVATHNLNLEGAPLFLVDYVTHLVRSGSKVTIASGADGPLLKRFEAAGATVLLVEVGTITFASSGEIARTEIQRLGRQIDISSVDLIVGNTFTTFWIIHAAKLARKPSLLYVHESTTPGVFYRARAHPEVISLVEEAFALADVVSFTTTATRNYHLNYGRPENHRLTPGWIDVARIDRWHARQTRTLLRTHFHLQPGELLVTNIGTVCERKGQHIFARAVDLLWQRYPALAARTRFIMLGGGNTAFDDFLHDLLTQLNRPNLIVHSTTADYFPYYAAADLFVCSTFEESSPRVILEAMACGTPILSSDVHGISEQVRDGAEASLVRAGDTHALCEGIARLLLHPEIALSQAAAARARVLTEFDSVHVLPLHAALAARIVQTNASLT